jgi:hypothetical protein
VTTSKSLLPTEFGVHAARQLRESVSEQANTMYYLFVGRPLPFDDETVPAPTDSVADKLTDAYRTMVLGKQARPADVALCCRRVDWTANTVYDPYDDQDPLLQTRDFFVQVDAGSYHHVWKCLDNHGGLPSTVQPDFAEIDEEDEVYQTSDGYRWRYLYSVDDSTFDKFSTEDRMPVYSNTTVVGSAVAGAVDVIVVDSAGQGYRNHLSGTLSTTDLRVDGNSLVYAVSSSGPTSNGVLDGCWMYLTSGTGSGQYRRVAQYVANSTAKYVVVDEPFETNPTNGTEYEITPRVVIVGDGGQSVQADARALVNAVGNTVDRVEMLSRGAGYQVAIATVAASNVVGQTSNAELRVVMGPPMGHGYDPVSELGARAVCFSVTLANSESNTIPTSNDYRRVGILRDPLWTSVSLEVSGEDGEFSPGEVAWEVSPVPLYHALSTTSGNTTAVFANVAPAGYLSAGDGLLLVSNTQRQLVDVVSATANATHTSVVLSAQAAFTNTSTLACLAGRSACSTVTEHSTGVLTVGRLSGQLSVGSELVGAETGARCVVDTVSVSGEERTFSTFVQLVTYEVTGAAGTFEEDETVFQTSVDTANAVLHSANSTRIRLSDQVGIMTLGVEVVGSESGARATPTTKYEPEVVFGSGEVLYLEHQEAVTRGPSQSETFKVVIEF